MSDGIGIGIIGSGGIGRMHAEAAQRAGSRIVGCFDPNAGAAAALAADFADARALDDLDALLGLPGLDAVVVAAPNAHHVPLALRAMEAGRDVLLEKPMATSLAEADRLLAAASSSDRVLQVGFVCRCSPIAREVAALVAAGRLGRLYHARAQWWRRRGVPGLGGWFTTRAQSGGGVLLDLGVHVIDLVMHLAGRPVALRASGACTSLFGPRMRDYVHHEMWGGPPRFDGVCDVEDGATALIRFEGGLTLELALAWAANVVEERCGNGVTLLGERGGAAFDLWTDRIDVALEEEGRLADLRPRVVGTDLWDEGWTEQHRRFAGHVRARTAPEASAADGRAVQAILEAIYRSSEAGAEVPVAPAG